MVELMINGLEEVAQEITGYAKNQEEKTFPLREAIEKDYDIWRLKDVPLSKERGVFRTMTTNRPKVYINKLIDEFANAVLRLEIPDLGDTDAARRREAETEKAAYGLINLMNDNMIARGFPSIKAQTAFKMVLRRAIVWRPLLYDEDGECVADLGIWDFRNTYWSYGRRGLSRVCYVHWEETDVLEDLYNQKFEGDERGVKVYDNWDLKGDEFKYNGKMIPKVKETVVIDGKVVKEPNEYELPHLPILILPCGSATLLQQDSTNDSIKDLGDCWFSEGRNVWPKISELRTYEMTTTAKGTKPTKKVFHDSKLGGKPPKLQGEDEIGSEIMLDAGQGQDVVEIDLPENSPALAQLSAELGQEATLAELPLIMYGYQDMQTTAQGTSQLIHAGMTKMKNGLGTGETAYSWLANEVVAQFKNSKFEVQVQGVDNKGKRFAGQIKKDDLVTDRRIEAKLTIDVPQDKYVNASIIETYLKNGVYSVQTAMEEAGIEDPDGEKDIQSREKGKALVPMEIIDAIDDFTKDKSPEAKKYAWFLEAIKNGVIEQTVAQYMQKLQGGGQPAPQGNAPGIPQGQPNMTKTPDNMKPPPLNNMGRG